VGSAAGRLHVDRGGGVGPCGKRRRWDRRRHSLRKRRHVPDADAAALRDLAAFVDRATAFFAQQGIRVRRVLTDNGSCYRAFDFRDACRDLGLRHIRTKPYTPKTNGKAERFIQTALREWAYAQAYPTSDRRAEELPFWLHRYNWHRPHGGIKSKTPISRLALSEDNLLRLHS